MSDCFRADQIQKMFNEFDKDGSGSVSVNEAKDVLRKLKIPDHEIECLVAQHDKNNDGELQYEEFVSFLLHTWLRRRRDGLSRPAG